MKLARKPTAPSPAGQRGVVLIIALVMLVVISLLATFSIRNSVSSEAVSGNVRTSQLASQAAEIALRFCEKAVVDFVRAGNAVATNGTTGIPIDAKTLYVLANVTPPKSLDPVNWDKVTTDVLVLPEAEVNLGGSDNYRRMPECMVEQVPVVAASGTALTNTTTFLVTARGFGPEVADDAARGRPNGSEVWLQSTIELE